MAPSILGNANANLAIPLKSALLPPPITNFIILENGVDFMETEAGGDLMIRE
jgi:hypothetical protein|tara:strand:+ start:7656 stop:7811 length:156 start_codon:yes stop_codon:yes gene_type:complete